jgi:hypothetical protein
MIEELDDKQEFEQEFELADMAADDDDSILSLLPQSRSSAPANSGFGLAGAQWRLEDAARSMSMAREQIRREAQEELERELELPPNWRERDRSRNLERWHQRMALRAKASGRPRCEHGYVDGTRCRAPRLDSGRLCYAHEEMEQVCPSRPSGPNAAARKVNLRPMEDGNSIMLNIMEINRALLEQEITEQQARILLSSQQMGLRALKDVTFKLTAPELMVKELAGRMMAEKDFTAKVGKRATESQSCTAENEGSAEQERQLPADERRKTQIGGAGSSRERARTNTNEQDDCSAEDAESAEMEEVAADQPRNPQMGGEELTEKRKMRSGAEAQFIPSFRPEGLLHPERDTANQEVVRKRPAV